MIHAERQKSCIAMVALLVGALVPLCMGTAGARIQDDGGSYRTGEKTQASEETESAVDATSSSAQDGPVRLARFSYVKGNVTWRADAEDPWSAATTNLPLRQGAQAWIAEGGRAEIQFDDGSVLRLGSGALVTLQTLYSDEDGEFTEIKLNDGVIALRLKHDKSVYQINAPLVSVKANGPARLRVGAGDGVEVAVRQGQATVEGAQGKAVIREGSYLDVPDDSAPLEARRLPRPDSFDNWNADQDRRIDQTEAAADEKYLPSNIALVADDLGDYGSWRDDAEYGHVWCPRAQAVDWRPYSHGCWVWVSPFGWTWVSEEPWGWAPYHYGSWIRRPFGWAWVPGPVHQYWSPAVVRFYECDDSIAWVPLAPIEVRYPPTLAIGFHGGNWSLFFSIGGAAVYLSNGHDYCEPRPWSSHYINRFRYTDNRPIWDERFHGAAYKLNHGYVPVNARFSGATMVNSRQFGGSGAYRPIGNNASAIFARSREFGTPGKTVRPFAGPPTIRPNALSMTTTRTFDNKTVPPQSALNRNVYRANDSRVRASDSGDSKGRTTGSSSDGQGGRRRGQDRLQLNSTRPSVNTGRATSADTTERRQANVPGVAARTSETRVPAADRTRKPDGTTANDGSSASTLRQFRKAGSSATTTNNAAEEARQARRSLGLNRSGGESGVRNRGTVQPDVIPSTRSTGAADQPRFDRKPVRDDYRPKTTDPSAGGSRDRAPAPRAEARPPSDSSGSRDRAPAPRSQPRSESGASGSRDRAPAPRQSSDSSGSRDRAPAPRPPSDSTGSRDRAPAPRPPDSSGSRDRAPAPRSDSGSRSDKTDRSDKSGSSSGGHGKSR